MGNIKLGVIGIINEDTKNNLWGTMQRLADLGYSGVEAGPMQLLEGDTSENMRRFHGLGLEVITVSADSKLLTEGLDKLIGQAHALGAPHATVWRLPTDTRDEVMRATELLETAGKKLAAEGIKLCYHNHEFEFVNVFNGVSAIDLMAEYSDPKHVFFELDIAWATFAGEKPANIIRKMKNRIPAIHIKDLYGKSTWDHSYEGYKQQIFTALGTGDVNLPEGIKAAVDAGIGWMVVEQDLPRNLKGMDIVTLDALYLREMGLI